MKPNCFRIVKVTVLAIVFSHGTVFAEDSIETGKMHPRVTPACEKDPSDCLEGYVTRSGITLRDRLGKGDFDSYIRRNELEEYGLTPDSLLQEGPLLLK